jgi:hypothetical protein
MMWMWWAIPLACAVFIWSLNEHLRGLYKEAISGVFAIAILGLLIIAFIISGWLIGLITIAATFILLNLMRPVTQAVARKLIPYPSYGRDDDDFTKPVMTMEDLQSDRFWEERDREQELKNQQREECISKAERHTKIHEAMQELSASVDDLGALYDRIEQVWQRHDVVVKAMKNSELFRWFILNSKPCESDDGKYCREMTMDEHVFMLLWLQSNPAGKAPK